MKFRIQFQVTVKRNDFHFPEQQSFPVLVSHWWALCRNSYSTQTHELRWQATRLVFHISYRQKYVGRTVLHSRYFLWSLVNIFCNYNLLLLFSTAVIASVQYFHQGFPYFLWKSSICNCSNVCIWLAPYMVSYNSFLWAEHTNKWLRNLAMLKISGYAREDIHFDSVQIVSR